MVRATMDDTRIASKQAHVDEKRGLVCLCFIIGTKRCNSVFNSEANKAKTRSERLESKLVILLYKLSCFLCQRQHRQQRQEKPCSTITIAITFNGSQK